MRQRDLPTKCPSCDSPLDRSWTSPFAVLTGKPFPALSSARNNSREIASRPLITAIGTDGGVVENCKIANVDIGISALEGSQLKMSNNSFTKVGRAVVVKPKRLA